MGLKTMLRRSTGSTRYCHDQLEAGRHRLVPPAAGARHSAWRALPLSLRAVPGPPGPDHPCHGLGPARWRFLAEWLPGPGEDRVRAPVRSRTQAQACVLRSAEGGRRDSLIGTGRADGPSCLPGSRFSRGAAGDGRRRPPSRGRRGCRAQGRAARSSSRSAR